MHIKSTVTSFGDKYSMDFLFLSDSRVSDSNLPAPANPIPSYTYMCTYVRTYKAGTKPQDHASYKMTYPTRKENKDNFFDALFDFCIICLDSVTPTRQSST